MKQITKILALAASVALAGCSTMQSSSTTPSAEPALQVYAAGSLRGALTTIASDYEQRTGQKVALTFGASGLLRERIEKGEAAQVFASADNDHPQRLARQGGWQPSTVFTRNTLCALTSDKVDTSPKSLLTTLLRSDVRLGTSTPKADPSGDYAWALFEKAQTIQPGAYATLSGKAKQLVGSATSPQSPDARSTYAWIMDTDQADVFLTYCTNAVAAQKEVPRLKVVQLPPELQVGAAYGMTVRQGSVPAASAFASYLLEPQAQAVFSRLGFGRP